MKGRCKHKHVNAKHRHVVSVFTHSLERDYRGAEKDHKPQKFLKIIHIFVPTLCWSKIILSAQEQPKAPQSPSPPPKDNKGGVPSASDFLHLVTEGNFSVIVVVVCQTITRQPTAPYFNLDLFFTNRTTAATHPKAAASRKYMVAGVP